MKQSQAKFLLTHADLLGLVSDAFGQLEEMEGPKILCTGSNKAHEHLPILELQLDSDQSQTLSPRPVEVNIYSQPAAIFFTSGKQIKRILYCISIFSIIQQAIYCDVPS